MAQAARKTGAKAMVRAAGTSGETSRGRVAGTSSIPLKGSAAGGAASRTARPSFETGDDAADQIAAVERAKIDPIAPGHRLKRCDQLDKPALCVPAKRLGRLDRDR